MKRHTWDSSDKSAANNAGVCRQQHGFVTAPNVENVKVRCDKWIGYGPSPSIGKESERTDTQS